MNLNYHNIENAVLLSTTPVLQYCSTILIFLVYYIYELYEYRTKFVACAHVQYITVVAHGTMGTCVPVYYIITVFIYFNFTIYPYSQLWNQIGHWACNLNCVCV